ncbi:MAG: hypothetical protein JWM98_349 [Thermoleophilia bacterium]|nr:hypothetical protein [Thermoleophilia bacterium]
MTSLLPPYVFALAQASQASTALANAAVTARDAELGRSPLPDAAPGLVRIPEMSGPDSPDNPFFVAPEPTVPATGLARAAIYGEQGIGHIDQALAVGTQLSAGVVTAFTNARSEALLGVESIRKGAASLLAPGAVALKFDAAGLWLGMARNLLQLENGGITRPPVTILPVPTPDVDGGHLIHHPPIEMTIGTEGGHLIKHPPIKMTMGA